MKRPILLIVLLCALAGGAIAAPPKKKKGKGKGKPTWPVPNPSFQRVDFVPSSANRQLSGMFGPRLKWGSGRYDHHEGFDFYAFYDKQRYPRGDHPVLSILPGVVSEVIAPPGLERTEVGRKVIVTHDVPWTAFGGKSDWGQVRSAYLHLSKINVKQGQRLKAGDEIGRAGESGHTTTVHLHFNLYRSNNINVNPARVFSPKHFPAAVVPIHKKTVEIEWLERDKDQGTAIVRVLLARNAYTLDGFVLQVDKDASRAVSFEHVTAKQRSKRDTGDRDLFPNLRVFPMRFNGGGAIERLNADRVPSSWPISRYKIEGGRGVRIGFDLLATNVPAKAKKIKLTVFSVHGKKVSATAKRFKVER